MKKTLFVFYFICGAVLFPAITGAAPVKLAIIPESPDAAAAVDVLTAEFSKDSNLQVLERAEIEKVYREQGLAAGSKDYLKLGRLLGADGLLAVKTVTEQTNQFLSLQLVAVRPGVILSDERYGRMMNDAAGWARNIAQHLGPLLPKLLVLPQDALPISVVSFHAGVRTREEAELEQQMHFLTIERLVQEQKLFVLERKRMQALSEEKELAGNEAEPFWNGRYLLDGTIDRDGFSPDVVTISARLIPPGGNPILIEASGRRTNCIEVVNQLAEKVQSALKLEANPTAWNTTAEADRFFKEAQWYLAWKIFPQARQSAEAAWALGKQDSECMNLRVRTFMPPPDSGIIYYPPREKPSPQKIDDAIQAARLYLGFSRDLPADEPKLDSDWYKLGLDNLTILTRVLQQFNWSPEFYTPVADKLAELRAEARLLAALLSRAPSVRDSYFIGSRKASYDELYHFQEQPGIFALKVEGGCLWQEKPEDTLAIYRELMSSPVFRYLHERLWFRDADHSSSRVTMPPRLVAWNKADRERLPETWQRFVAELRGSQDVFLQMEARALRLADTESLSRQLSMAGGPDAYKAALKKYDAELTFAFTDFFDAYLTNRLAFRTNSVDVLYLEWGVDDLLQRMGGDVVTTTKESLQKQYRTEYTAKLAAKDKELEGVMVASRNEEAFAKQKQFLQEKQTYDPQTFVKMFIFGFKNYSREQAQEIKPLLAEYKKTLSGNRARIGQMQVGQVEANVDNILNPKTVATPSPNNAAVNNGNPARPPGGNFPPGRPNGPGQPGMLSQGATSGLPPDHRRESIGETPPPDALVSSNILTVRDFYPLPMEGLPGDRPSEFRFTGHQLVEGKLLLDFRYHAWIYSSDKDGNWKSSAGKVFVGIAIFDPVTKGWTLATLPEAFNEPVFLPARPSVLWHGDLFSSHAGKIRKYDFQKKVWESAGFPVEGCAFYNLNGRLFVADNNSIQEIVENGRSTKLLASIQRQPPVTSLDSQGALINLALFIDAQKFLCAAVHNKIFRWDGADWQNIGAAAASYPPSVSEDGVLFLTDGWNLRPTRISCLKQGSGALELCVGTDGHANPVWRLPTAVSLPNLSATLWKSDLFLMADAWQKNDIAKDEYNSALYYFSRGQATAGKLLLKFDHPQGFPPMAGVGENSRAMPGVARFGPPPMNLQIGFTTGWMLFTPDFLICGRECLGNFPGKSEPNGFSPGIWVTPSAPILSELSSLQKQQSIAQEINNKQAKELAQAAEAKDRAAMHAFLDKYDRNHNGLLDQDEREDARDDPNFTKFMVNQLRAERARAAEQTGGKP